MPDNELIAGIDLGTTSVKASVYELNGEAVYSGTTSYKTYHPKSSWSEQHPADWMAGIKQLLRNATNQIEPERVCALGICSQVNTHVFVNQQLEVLIPAIVWQDQRCAAVVSNLEEESERLGLNILIDFSSLVSRAEWVRRNMPQVWQQTRYILSPKDYCIATLTGSVASDALSSIGLVTESGESYDPGLDQLVPGLSDRLPALKALTDCIGEVQQSDLPLTCPVTVGTMDAWASLYGTGAVETGSGFQISGTSEIIGVLSVDSFPAQGIVSFPPVQGTHLHAGPTQCGGDALAWFAQSQGMDIPTILEMAENAPSERAPLLFLPHLMGERAPLWNPSARGAFVGLTRTHTAADMALAVLEGVGFSARHLLEEIERAAGLSLDSLRLCGGGARSDLWCQIKANIHGKTLQRVKNIDTGCFGAALIAAAGVGAFADIETAATQAVTIDRVFHPVLEQTRAYDELYGVYRATYRGLESVFADLARLGERSLQ